MFVASLSNIKMDCLGIRFYWLFICDRGPQSKSINQSAVAGSKFATNENIFCSFSVVFTHIEKMAMCRLQHTPTIIIMVHLWTSFMPLGLFQTKINCFLPKPFGLIRHSFFFGQKINFYPKWLKGAHRGQMVK